ncbi:hypothetical protein [Kineosporia sp. NBRC 101731]|uniref:hypothetical protein n=1 Tax=Kineosporia sp. NBRC 101731 TaxID=3032199 RepID=UPI00249FAE37|nr:hypothetical protein [Kineosporia sp. NBRC 101731]GLY32443.1 hypothetical protein Kisp02_58080 [Kineosporia sp. NBRC 101731]
MWRWTVVGIGLLVALGGCGEPETVEVVTAAAETSAMTDCGTEVLDQSARISDQGADCFLGAVTAGDPATLEVTYPTVEGDPITQVFRNLGSGEIQVETDSTKDRFGSGEVETQVCTGPSRSSFALTFDECH